jgi:hypothetical protein
MKLLDILKEVIDEEIRRKSKMNKHGVFKSLYNFETKPDYVIKTWTGNNYMVEKEYNVFEKYPDLFANILKVDWEKKYMIQERLDADRAFKELSELGDVLEVYISAHLKDVASSNKEYQIHEDREILSMVDKNLVPIYNKWLEFFKKVIKIDIGSNPKDTNPGNFGYDKSGKIKLLDI